MTGLITKPVHPLSERVQMIADAPDAETRQFVERLVADGGQELKSYDQSWRDRAAGWLIDRGMPETTVEGLMGSRGLGTSEKNMGMGLVDMTPLGLPFWLNEAERARGAGDMGGQMLNTIAAVPIPGAKAGAKLIEEGVDAAQTGIRAYHGSPHDFDRFDMSKIGTGEGAQAYGHGLYFAEREGVARSYRDKLAGDNTAADTAQWLMIEANTKDPAIAARYADEYLAEYEAGSLPFDLTAAEIAKLQQARDMLRAGTVPVPGGKMYEARINASPDEFLDWDKPLSEQSEKVQKVFKEKFSRALSITVPSEKGKSLYSAVGATNYEKGRETAEAAFQALRAAGIKGIRYLDQGSRGKEGGTSNFVVFDDNIIDIIRKYGIAGLIGGGTLAGAAGGEAKAGQ